MRGKQTIAWLAWVVALGACGFDSQLAPAPNALTLPEHSEVAYQRDNGVTVVVNSDAWRGYPSDLPWVLTPLEVRIENHSGRPLKLSYANFALVSAQGARFAPLPVLGTQGQQPAQPAPQPPQPNQQPNQPSLQGAPPTSLAPSGFSYVPAQFSVGIGVGGYAYPYPYQHFFVSPMWSYHYPVFPVWPGPFYYDPYYYSGYYGYWYQPLPTQDMVSGALPEGVLEDKGMLIGYLYFQRITASARAVDFEMALVDANTGERFGTVRVPFMIVN